MAYRGIVNGNPLVAEILQHCGNFTRHILDIRNIPGINLQHLVIACGITRQAQYESAEKGYSQITLPYWFYCSQIHYWVPLVPVAQLQYSKQYS